MTEDEPTIWGIHGGTTGDANKLFLEQNFVALGWDEMGDLSGLAASREAFKAAVTEAFPDMKAGAIPGTGGQLYRFIHEMKDGDFIAYPSKLDRHIHLGKITGPYVYDPGRERTYPNLRPVTWLQAHPRTRFSQGALYEIGAAQSFFQIKNNADEFLAAMESESFTTSTQEDVTIHLVAEDIEETTRDFIIKRLARELKGHPFAGFVANLLQTMGFRTRVSPEGPDGGIDIVAHKDELGFEPPIVKVQVKSGEGSVGDPVVSALFGKVADGEVGLLVTLGTATSQAKAFAGTKSNLRLIDGDALVELILEHYDQLDSRYKGLLPLKRVFIPEAVEEAED